MTVRTRTELNSDADTYINDNGSGEVTPADVRQRVKDLADSAFLAEDLPFTKASSSAPASLDFAEGTDNGSHRVRVKAPDSLAADVDVTLPSATGTLQLTSQAREVLTAARTYYVRTDGSDSNDGLTDSSGGAFLTIQKAVNVAMALDLSIYDVAIDVADGTYAETVSITGPRVGSGQITISGNTTTPANVEVNKISCYDHAEITVEGLELQSTDAIDCNNGSMVYLGAGMAFVTGRALQTRNGSSIVGLNGSITLNAGVTQIANCIIRSFINLFGSTITLSGTPAWVAGGGIISDSQSYVRLDSVTFSGSATGKRYAVGAQALISTGGGGASFIPGNSAGTVDSTNFGAYT